MVYVVCISLNIKSFSNIKVCECGMGGRVIKVFAFDISFEVTNGAIMLCRCGIWPIGDLMADKMEGNMVIDPCLAMLLAISFPMILVCACDFWIVMLCLVLRI